MAIAGTGNKYEVSDRGEVRLVEGKRLLKQTALPTGYLRVWVRMEDGRRRQRYVHHLVLESFVGPRPQGQQTLHLDDVPSNNRVANLRWGTAQENIDMRDAGGNYYSKKTHCPQGHEYTPTNTYRHRRGRQCRTCQRERMRARRSQA